MWLLVACLTVTDVRNEVCRALCRNDGYDSGSWAKTSEECFCANKVRFSKVTKIPRVIHDPEPPDPDR